MLAGAHASDRGRSGQVSRRSLRVPAARQRGDERQAQAQRQERQRRPAAVQAPLHHHETRLGRRARHRLLSHMLVSQCEAHRNKRSAHWQSAARAEQALNAGIRIHSHAQARQSQRANGTRRNNDTRGIHGHKQCRVCYLKRIKYHGLILFVGYYNCVIVRCM